jgi:hypothetical protein
MIELPNIKEMTADQFIMWICAAVLLYLLLMNPLALNSKMDDLSKVQAQMVVEHHDLLKAAQVQCYNHAENNPDQAMRQNQQRRCLTLQINAMPN